MWTKHTYTHRQSISNDGFFSFFKRNYKKRKREKKNETKRNEKRRKKTRNLHQHSHRSLAEYTIENGASTTRARLHTLDCCFRTQRAHIDTGNWNFSVFVFVCFVFLIGSLVRAHDERACIDNRIAIVCTRWYEYAQPHQTSADRCMFSFKLIVNSVRPSRITFPHSQFVEQTYFCIQPHELCLDLFHISTFYKY